MLTLRAGFEPAREDPIGFRVQRLNHSAIAAARDRVGEYYVLEPWFELLCNFLCSAVDKASHPTWRYTQSNSLKSQLG